MTSLMLPAVLVIDAQQQSLQHTLNILGQRDYRPLGAVDRASAIEIAAATDLDLILCDIQLNGLPGSELVEEIRKLPQRQDVPVMFMSSSQVADVISRPFQQTSVFIVRKPLDPVLLVDLIEKSLWMPHLIKSHINKPHLPMRAFNQPTNNAAITTSVPTAQ